MSACLSSCQRILALQDAESFLHRSGRTGRAGRNGTTIAMVTKRETGWFRRMLKECKVEDIEMIAPPSPKDVMEAAARSVSTVHRRVSCSCLVLPRAKWWPSTLKLPQVVVLLALSRVPRFQCCCPPTRSVMLLAQ